MNRYIIEIQGAGLLPLIRELPAPPAGEKLTDAERLDRIATWIDNFDKLTSDNEYTDVGDSWELFNDIRNLARGGL